MKNEFLEALGSNNANNNTDLSLYIEICWKLVVYNDYI